MDQDMDNKQFHGNFQTTIADLEESIARVSAAQSAEQRKIDADAIRARISRLTRDLADVSTQLPRYDQRNYNESLKTITTNLNVATEKAAPKPRFQFRRGAANARSEGPIVADSRKLTNTHASSSTQRSSRQQNSLQIPPSETTTKSLASGTSTLEKDYNAQVSAQTSLVRKPSFSSAKEVFLAHHSNIRISLPESAAAATAAGRLTDVEECIVDMSGATRMKISFAAFAMKNISNSVVVSGTVTGPVHITAIRNSVLVIVARQVRIHECHNIDIYLHCGSRPIIEDCSNLRFAPVTEYYSPGNLLGANQWDQVDDFKWLKADVSPNWSVLPEEKAVGDNVWREVEQDTSSDSTALWSRLRSW
ncbi:hypothetical protein BROUX41_005037 [Berkeleyomyces rouxiae]|uniref:uncharacterized protein n=1 Tax=Berkeleyomyces rouxiae TaxID=2035830 RepID=UPI003B7C6643